MDFGETEDASLTNDKIKWVQDKPTHGDVEPAAKMKYGDYKGALEATSGNWTKKPGAGGGGGGKPSGGGGKD
ncbi:MAG: hypothetical protein U1F43_05895 [Myxococcota bacterium]